MDKVLQFYNYDASYSHYTSRILNIRQAKKYGEVIVAKPVLMLALIDGIENGVFIDNRFTLNDWFELRYEILMRKYTQNSIFDRFSPINNPFWHLESDGFWHLYYHGEQLTKTHTPSTKWLKENVRYASMDDDLWILLQNQIMRQRLRDYIIEHKLTDDHDNRSLMVAETLGMIAAVLVAA